MCSNFITFHLKSKLHWKFFVATEKKNHQTLHTQNVLPEITFWIGPFSDFVPNLCTWNTGISAAWVPRCTYWFFNMRAQGLDFFSTHSFIFCEWFVLVDFWICVRRLFTGMSWMLHSPLGWHLVDTQTFSAKIHFLFQLRLENKHCLYWPDLCVKLPKWIAKISMRILISSFFPHSLIRATWLHGTHVQIFFTRWNLSHRN